MADHDKFAVPEPPTGIGSGLLPELWQSNESLPTLNSVQRGLYFTTRAVESLLALPMSNLITVMTIAVSLFLFSGFLLILQNVDRVIGEAGSSMYLTAYIKVDAPEAQVTDFVRSLEKDNSFRDVKFVSKEDAIDIFRRDLGPHAGFVDGLEQDNPLPASVDLMLTGDELGINSVRKVVERLRVNPVVEEVVYGSEWVERMQAVVRVFRFLGVVALIIVLVIIVFLISNTIKLVIYSRRDEIGVMQLVGATDNFIKLPFIIGGLIQGAVGSILALVVLKICFALVDMQLQNSTLLSVALPGLQFLGPLTMIAIILVGVIVGAVGSLFALGRFMDV